GRRIRAHRPLAGGVPGPRHQPRGVRHQPPGRCAARPARSETAQLTASPKAMPTTPAPAAAPADPLLAVDRLKTYFYMRQGAIKAVDGVSLTLAAGETLAIVGESGWGKSITALSLIRLVPDPPGRIAGGSVKLAGIDLLRLSENEMRDVRGKEI